MVRQLLKTGYQCYAMVMHRHLLVRNRELVGRHSGQPGFILMNGASLGQVDVAALSSKVTFGCNHLPRHRDFDKLRLTYYAQLHSLRHFRTLTDPAESIESQLDALTERTAPGHLTTGLFHWSVADIAERYRGRSLRESYLFLNEGRRVDPLSWNGDLTGPNPFMVGSVYFMLTLALTMGCKEIYLLGAGYTCRPYDWGYFYDPQDAKPQLRKDFQQRIEPMHETMRALTERDGARIINVIGAGYESPVYDSITVTEFNTRFRCTGKGAE